MSSNLSELPKDLPRPIDDGAASHLRGMTLPKIALTATSGVTVDLGTIPGLLVLYVYPMTGRPGVPLPDGWDGIPGARGCTPQSCSFRDHYAELKSLNAAVFGLSSQCSDYQREARERLHLPFELLSDNEHLLRQQLGFPTFNVAGKELYKRLALIVVNGQIRKVFYPVFPPDQNATDVLTWLRHNVLPDAAGNTPNAAP